MKRVYMRPLREGSVEVSGDDHHYLFRVLRLTTNAEVQLFDGQGTEALATVADINARTARLAVGALTHHQRPATTLISLVSLIKGERMDWCLQKLVELGVSRIVPIKTDRTVVKLDGARASQRQKRYQQIAIRAAAQCRTPFVPEVAEAIELEGALRSEVAELRLVFAGKEPCQPAGQLVDGHRGRRICLLTGPEGGFTDDELAHCEAAGYRRASLGPRILRAETAAMVAAAIIGYSVGDIGASI